MRVSCDVAPEYFRVREQPDHEDLVFHHYSVGHRATEGSFSHPLSRKSMRNFFSGRNLHQKNQGSKRFKLKFKSNQSNPNPTNPTPERQTKHETNPTTKVWCRCPTSTRREKTQEGVYHIFFFESNSHLSLIVELVIEFIMFFFTGIVSIQRFLLFQASSNIICW